MFASLSKVGGHTRKGVNIFDSRTVLLGASFPLSFCLFTTGPSRLDTIAEDIFSVRKV